MTKAELLEEIKALRAQLYQERQDHSEHIKRLKETASQMIKEARDKSKQA